MKKSEGFIKLFRNYFRSVYWCKERRFSQAEALLDLIAQARFDTACVVQRMGGTDVLVGRGQLVLSLRYLARRWQWSVHCVQLFLYQLRDTGAVELETHRQFHLLTVVDLADFGGVPVVKQKVTPSSARRRKASGAAAGEAFPQLSGDTLGTPCGTKKKKKRTKKPLLREVKKRPSPLTGRVLESVLPVRVCVRPAARKGRCGIPSRRVRARGPGRAFRPARRMAQTGCAVPNARVRFLAA